MKKTIKPANPITGLDIAKKLGQEKEYLQALQEQEIKKNFDILMGEIPEENNQIINENKDE